MGYNSKVALMTSRKAANILLNEWKHIPKFSGLPDLHVESQNKEYEIFLWDWTVWNEDQKPYSIIMNSLKKLEPEDCDIAFKFIRIGEGFGDVFTIESGENIPLALDFDFGSFNDNLTVKRGSYEM